MELSATTTGAVTTAASNQTIRIIRNFLDFFNSYQFETILNNEFEQLKQLTNEIRIYKTKSTYEGEKECNRKKNRYRDIVPYDETRVILNDHDNDNESKQTYNGNDYINASFVRGALDDQYKYIAAQGPSKETIIDFVRMLVQFNIKIVICACNEYEGQKLKCFRYWTDKLNENLNLYKNYYISLKSKPVMFDGCIIRELVVRNLKPSNPNDLNKEYEFTQFHITNWPDHGVPNNIESIMNTLRIVRHKLRDDSMPKQRNKTDYLAVHCSAGCGRTGTIIAIDQLWTLLKENKLNDDFSLFKIAYSLREQRIAMIQTLSQYQLFAKAVVHLFEEALANQNNNNNTIKTKPFPVRPTHSNYDNLSSLTYTKSNQQSTIRSISPLTLKQSIEKQLQYDTNDQLLKQTYTSPNNKRTDSNNNVFNESLNDYSKQTNGDSNKTTPKSTNVVNGNQKSSKSETSQSLSVKPKSSRFTPNSLFNIFTPNLSKSDKNNKSAPSSASSNYPVSSTPSTTASLSPIQSANKNDYENMSINSKKSNDDSSSQNLSSSIYLSVNSKSNLTRSLMVTPASKTYLTSKSITVDSNNNNGSSNYLNLKQITNDSTSSSISSTNNGLTSSSSNNAPKQQTLLQFNKTASPQFPRKLFHSNETNNEPLSMSYTESASNNNNDSLNNSVRNNNHSELYINDASLNKKEPGSVCEFLSNKLESNKYKSTAEHNNLISMSTMSDSNITPTNYTVKSTKNFVLSPNQARLGSVKQTDLRQANPPLKAELFESLPKATLDNNNKSPNVVIKRPENNNDDEDNQPPKPPARRSKKAIKSSNAEDEHVKQTKDQSDNSTKPIEAKKLTNFSIKYDKSSYNTKPTTQSEAGVIFRSSRSNSSTYYDNQSEISYDNHEHNSSIRNALLIDPIIQQELQNQQQNNKTKQPQLRLKTQKSVDSSISQTLPSRKSMSSLNNNYEANIEQIKKKEALNQTTANYNHTNHVGTQRSNHFSHHFNFPYRIQFAKTNDPYQNGKHQQVNKYEAPEDGKYFLYNNKIKNDINYLRNSENLSEINQIKRRSAHLFNL